MPKFKDIKIIRKIQVGFFVIAAVSTVIAINSFIQMNNAKRDKESLFTEFLQPQYKIHELYTRFQTIQFTLVKFSISGFEDQFPDLIKKIGSEKAAVDSVFKYLSAKEFDQNVKDNISDVQKTWINYKTVVIDAILSAGLMKDFEMASVVTTTSAEEISAQMERKFTIVEYYLQNRGTTLSGNITYQLSSGKSLIIIGALVGALVFILAIFLIAPTITKPIGEFKLAMEYFSKGNFNIDLIADSKDEFGEMKSMLIQFRDAQKEKIKAAEKISNGIFEKGRTIGRGRYIIRG
ncbi:MAG: hypothetical protein CVV24_15325 [Ignavibacteriae bacterium HGW-Ignavibacteriae-3]|nr:MAG: hypothetical protein CVV24_15325 [Ignavibacteriae bacterium HGW-Ignavibacteriae-3]